MSNNLKFTIMTEPLDAKERVREGVKCIAGRHREYGGHSTVTRGLIEGLKKMGYKDFNYRPSEKDIYDTVHVLGGVRTLKYAIKLKKCGRIKHLSAGPNIVVFSTDYNSIVADKCVDLFITPSKWVSDDYVMREPSLKGRMAEWPVGVDMDRFKPSTPKGQRNGKKVLIYHKDESDQFCWHLDHCLKKRGYETSIIKYGSYTLDQYISLLNEMLFMVTLTGKESQGIYLPEAWSMDVPTICFDRGYYRWPGTDIDIEGDITSCPYISKENGVRFREIQEFEHILDTWDDLEKGMQPRKWCTENMSDVICAEQFVNMLNDRFGD